LKVNSGNVAGIKDYTIDKIKYVDGTDIKDVVFDGKRTVKVGVTYDYAPTATVSQLIIDIDSVEFDAKISDHSQLLAIEGNAVGVFLFDGEEIINKQKLSVGNNTLFFENLKPNTLYQYAIVANYDILDGYGGRIDVLQKHAFCTNKVLNISNSKITQDSFNFDFSISSKAKSVTVSSIKLFKDDTLIENLQDLTVREFKNLLSNNEYKIEVIYTYDLNDGAGAQTVVEEHFLTTAAKATPKVVITDIETTYTSVNFKVSIQDVDSVGNITAIQLYQDGEIVKTLEDLSVREFIGLLSDNVYKIEVTYKYDLNDGFGESIVLVPQTFITKAKTVPNVELVDVEATQETVSFDLIISDPDAIGELATIQLLKDGEVVKTLEDLSVREFVGLLSNNEYKIVVTYKYNLNDGVGVRLVTKEHLLTTTAKATPTVELVNVLAGDTTVGFDLVINDSDNVGEITAIELYQDGEVVHVIDEVDGRVVFTELSSDTDYEVVVTYTYNLNDGTGAHEYMTTTRNYPSLADFISLSVRNGYSILQVAEINEYFSYSDVLLKDETGTMWVNVPNEEITYVVGNYVKINLSSWQDGYSGEGYVTYDNYPVLITEVPAATTVQKPKVSLRTLPKEIPSLEIVNVVADLNSITFELDINDVSQVGSIVAIELYKGGTLVDSLEDLAAREFTGLLSNTEYEIVVTYKYDLNDGSGVQEYQTISRNYPSLADFRAYYVNQGYTVLQLTDIYEYWAISRLTLEDETGVFQIDVLSELVTYEVGDYLGMTLYSYQSLYTGEGHIYNYEGLTEVEEPETFTVSKPRVSIKTRGKEAPVLELVNVLATTESIAFEIDITDVDKVGAITSIELHKDGEKVQSLVDLTDREFTGLLSNNKYEIVVTYTYDLGDGLGERVFTLSGKSQKSTSGINVNAEGLVTHYSGSRDVVYINEKGIMASAFIGNYEMRKVIIGENVEFIGQQAFGNSWEGVPNLTEVYFLSTNPPLLGYDLFGTTWNSELFKIYVPIGMKDIYYQLIHEQDPQSWVSEDDIIEISASEVPIENINIRTLAKKTPVVELVNVIPDFGSITFDIDVTDIDKVGAITAIELYKDGEVVQSLTDLDVRKFTGLLLNNEYEIVVTYEYDLSDGKGVQEYAIINRHYPSLADFKAYKNTQDLTILQVEKINKYYSYSDVLVKDETGELWVYVSNDHVTFDVGDYIGLYVHQFAELVNGEVVLYSYDFPITYEEVPEIMTIDKLKTSIRTLAKAAPVVDILSVSSTSDTITFEIEVTDDDEVGAITAIELYKDGEVVQSLTDLNARKFTELLSNNEYEVVVTYTYDLSDGKGVQEYAIINRYYPSLADFKAYKNTQNLTILQVEKINENNSYSDVLVKDETGELWISVSNDHVTFDVGDYIGVYVDQYAELVNGEAVLYSYDVPITYEEVPEIMTIDKLKTSIRTLAKTTPVVELVDVLATTDSITFDINITDPDEVGAITAIELFKDGEIAQVLTNFNVKEFTELLSNTEYELVVTYTYDLSDGIGPRDYIITTRNYPTLADFRALTAQNSYTILQVAEITKRFSYSDVTLKDETGTFLIYPDNDTIDYEVGDYVGIKLGSYQSGYDGEVRVYNYGDPVLLTEVPAMTTSEKPNASIKTLTKVTPTIKIVNVEMTTDSVAFEIDITDVEKLGAITAIELFKDGEISHVLTDFNDREFTELLANNNYKIQVSYTYDLNDGVGEQVAVGEYRLRTPSKTTPVVEIVDVEVTNESISFEIDITDPDEVGAISAIELYQGDEMVQSLADLTARKFTGLLSNNEYKVVVTYKYDLADGMGVRTYAIIDRHYPSLADFKAHNYYSAETIIQVAKINKNSYDSDVLIKDETGYLWINVPNNSVTFEEGDYVVITLWGGAEPDTGYVQLYYRNIRICTEVPNIMTTYELKANATTKPKVMPYFKIVDVSFTTDSITFDIDITDVDETGTITAIKLYKDGEVVQSLTDLTNKEFIGLLANNEYEIVLTGTYDLNDGEGSHEYEMSNERKVRVRTLAKATPVVEIVDVEVTTESISFEIDIIDPDEVGAISAIELRKDGVVIQTLEDLTDREFTGLLSNNEYEIAVTYKYDLADGVGVRTYAIIDRHYPSLADFRSLKVNQAITFIQVVKINKKAETSDILVKDETGDLWFEISNSLITFEVGDYIEIVLGSWMEAETNYLHLNTYAVAGGLTEIPEIMTIHELKANVRTQAKTTPVVELVDVLATTDSITFDIDITDPDEVGAITAIELFKDTEIVQVLTDFNVKEFTELLSNTEYELVVTYTYDLNDGFGEQDYLLVTRHYPSLADIQSSVVERAYTILEVVELTQRYSYSEVLLQDETGTIWVYPNNDTVTYEVGDYVGIYLWSYQSSYDGEIYVSSLDSPVLLTEVPKIMTTHKPSAYISTQFNTTPVIEIDNVKATTNSVTFDIYITDPDGVGVITAIELFKDGEKVQSLEDLTAREFTGLLSNNEYEIIVTYTYDLNDGVGEQDCLVTTRNYPSLADFKALNLILTYTILQVVEIQQYFSVSDVTLGDETGTIVAHLDNDKVTYEVGDYVGITLNSYQNAYDGEIYIYLQDAPVLLTDVPEIKTIHKPNIYFRTQTKEIPVVEICNVEITTDSVTFGINITDTDEVGAITAVELYKDGEKVQSLEDLTAKTFTGLLSDNIYLIKVVYTYNLDDGVGEHVIVREHQLRTQSKTTPVIEIVNVLSTTDSITFGINITDPDGVGAITAIELHKDGEKVQSLEDLTARTFTGLLSNNKYEIVVTYTYDLNDGTGEKIVVRNYSIRTFTKATPDVRIVNIEATTDSITFGINITDVDEVGAITTIQLLRGELVVQTLEDFNVKEFTGLLSNNEYGIAVTYTYDLNDGVGERTIVNYGYAMTQSKVTPLAWVTNIEATTDSVTFDINIIDTDEVGALTAIELYKDGEKVQSLEDLTAKTFTGLLSDNIYSIKVVYTYNLDDGVGEQVIVREYELRTQSKTIPFIEIVDVLSTTNSVTLGINITDVDAVGAITAIELYKDDELVQSLIDLTARTFTGLLSNNEYEIVVTYTYDLNDGTGEKIVVRNNFIRTLTNATPDVRIINIETTTDSVTFGINITDTDEVGAITTIQLLRDGLVVQTLEDLNVREFTGLLSNNVYKIKLVYTYDLNDGVGERTIVNYGYVITQTKATPDVRIVNVEATTDSVTFSINITDTDEVGAITAIELYHYDEKVQSLEDLTAREFTGLLSSNVYKIEVVYTYDLNTGFGEQAVSGYQYVTTQSKATPVFEIVNVLSTTDSITFGINITDTDEVGAITAIELFKDGEKVQSLTDFNVKEFTDLLSNTEYEIVATYTYDLNDGFGEKVVVREHQLRTQSKTTPVIEIINVLSTIDSITFGINITDPDEVGAITVIELYKDGVVVQTLEDLTARTFTGLLSNNEYEVVITYTYDLNDGVGEQDCLVVTRYYPSLADLKSSVVESAYTILEVVELTQRYSYSEVLLQDETGTIWVYPNNDKVTYEVGDYVGIYLCSYQSSYDGEIYVTYMDDPVLLTEVPKIMTIHKPNAYISTQVKATPVVEIVNVEATINSVTFDINITDPDEVGAITAIELYKDGVAIQSLEDLTAGTFTGLLSNNEYEIVVTYTYDLNDGVGEQDCLVTTRRYPSLADFRAYRVNQGYTILKLINIYEYWAISRLTLEDETGTFVIDVLSESVTYQVGDYLGMTLYAYQSLYTGEGHIYTYDNLTEVGEQEMFTTSKPKASIRTRSKDTPTLELVNVSATTGSITFDIMVTDVHEVGAITAIELHKDGEMVQSLEDLTARTFTGLLSNNEYEIVVTYTYDLSDGVGERTFVLSGKSQESTAGLVINEEGLVDRYDGTQEVVYINEKGIMKYAFINNNTMRKVIIGENVEFIGQQAFGDNQYGVPNLTEVYFLSNTPPLFGFSPFGTTWNSEAFKIYVPIGMKAIYYQLIHEQDPMGYLSEDDIIEIPTSSVPIDNINIKTLAKDTPTVEIVNLQSTVNSITFEIDITDVHEVGSIAAIELYQGDTLVQSLEDLEAREFTELSSNTEYKIVVTYQYDLNDGKGVQDYVLAIRHYSSLADFRALRVNKAFVIIEVAAIRRYFAYSDILIKDETGDAWIHISNNLITFEVGDYIGLTLQAYQDAYSGEVHFYLDGNIVTYTEVPEIMTTYKPNALIKTRPLDISINTIEVLNTQILNGDVILFSVGITNPDNVQMKSIIVDGTEIRLESSSTTTNLRFKKSVFGEYETVTYTIQGVVLKDRDITLEVSDNNIIEIFVLPKIEILSAGQKNGRYYGTYTDSYDVKFNKPIASSLVSITTNRGGKIEQGNITVVNPYTIRVNLTSTYGGTTDFNITAIEIKIDDIIYPINISYSFDMFLVYSIDPVDIETVDDLISFANSNQVLNLKNDLDFEGITWTPIQFYGVLLGNGYKSKNIKMIDHSTTEVTTYALFTQVHGVIDNLHIDNLFISMEKPNLSGVAGLTHSNNGFITNVSVSGSIAVTTDSHIYIGGIATYNGRLIENSSVDIGIFNQSIDYSRIGGVAAYNYQKAEIRNINALVTINSSAKDNLQYISHFIGGLVGYNEGFIEKVQVNASIEVNAHKILAGGIAGENNGTIENSYVEGLVNITPTSTSNHLYTAGFAGYNSPQGRIKNSYSIVTSNVDNSNFSYSAGFVGDNAGRIENSFSVGQGFSQPFVKHSGGVLTNNYAIRTTNNVQYEGLIYKDSINEIIVEIDDVWNHTIWDFSQIDYILKHYPEFK
jgi:hypothetical protein